MGLAFALEMGAFWAHGMKKFQKLERLDERGARREPGSVEWSPGEGL